MAEDEEDEINELDFEAMREAAEERRENRRSQVTYEQVELIREAGELYRSQEDVDAVAEELDLSVETTEEHLAAYQLIFNDSAYIRRTAVDVGRGFFSLEKTVEEKVDDDVEDSVEDLLREYVGAVYLEYDVEEEPVEDPVGEDTPPFSNERCETLEKFAESLTFPTESLLAASTVASLQETLRQTQVQAIISAVEPLVRQRNQMLASAVEPLIRQRQEMLASAIQPLIEQRNQMMMQSLAPLLSAVESQQTRLATQMAELVSNAALNIKFPEPVLADLSSMQPAVNTAAVAAAASTPPVTGSSVTAEGFRPSVSAEPLEATATTVPEVDPIGATVDATLPSTDTVSAELVLELPAMIVHAMLSTGQARTWFTNLDEDHQLTVVRMLLAAVAVYLSQNIFYASIAILPERSVRRAIVDNEEERD